jgi:hypothetical protein
MTDDRTRKAILSRRAKFLAAALVTTLPACDREKEGIQPDVPTTAPSTDAGSTTTTASTAPPVPCLEIAEPVDAGPPPMPCLKIPPPTSDAGPKPHPHPCLKMSSPDF